MEGAGKDFLYHYPELQNIDEIRESINDILRGYFWYSKNLQDKITDLLNLLNDALNTIKPVEDDVAKKLLSALRAEDINKAQNEVRQALYIEMKNLSKIDAFLDEQNKIVKLFCSFKVFDYSIDIKKKS